MIDKTHKITNNLLEDVNWRVFYTQSGEQIILFHVRRFSKCIIVLNNFARTLIPRQESDYFCLDNASIGFEFDPLHPRSCS